MTEQEEEDCEKTLVEMHGKALQYWDARVGKPKKKRLEMITLAFDCEKVVARYVVERKKNDLAIYMYNSSAALMARMINRIDEEQELLRNAVAVMGPGGLRDKLEELIKK